MIQFIYLEIKQFITITADSFMFAQWIILVCLFWEATGNESFTVNIVPFKNVAYIYVAV